VKKAGQTGFFVLASRLDALCLPMTAAFVSAGFSEIVLDVGYTVASFEFGDLRVGSAFVDPANP
jgi:hypothetical protein